MTRRTPKKPAEVDATRTLLEFPKGYADWLADVKARILAAQQRAALAVNRELLALYWRIGRDTLERIAAGAWGDGIRDRISRDLRAAFPAMKVEAELAGPKPTQAKAPRGKGRKK